MSFIDSVCVQIENALHVLFPAGHQVYRVYPAEHIEEAELSTQEKKHAGGLMRVNHAGEIAAQGLYQGQALTANLTDVREQMQQAAMEEMDHLAWCAKRLQELGTHTSYLSPLWYFGSLAIGAVAGACGDKYSLGFVVATEEQVTKHLASHQQRLPEHDKKSLAIIEQMQAEEEEHARMAKNAGASELPKPIQCLMTLTATVMTSTAYWL